MLVRGLFALLIILPPVYCLLPSFPTTPSASPVVRGGRPRPSTNRASGRFRSSRPTGARCLCKSVTAVSQKPPQGFEPWTPALRKRCSTAELFRRKATFFAPAHRRSRRLSGCAAVDVSWPGVYAALPTLSRARGAYFGSLKGVDMPKPRRRRKVGSKKRKARRDRRKR